MILSTQIQAMLFAFLMGIGYGITFSFKQYLVMYSVSKKTKAIIDVAFHLIFVLLAYFGLYKINGGISNIYLFLVFLLAIYLYYTLYYEGFLHFFKWLKKISLPIYKKVYLLTISMYSIMFINKARKKRYGRKKKEEK